MSYEQIKDLPPPEFKRLCGVHIATFGTMVEVLQPELVRTGKKGGQPKLSVEDDAFSQPLYLKKIQDYLVALQSSRDRHYTQIPATGKIVSSVWCDVEVWGNCA